MDDKKQELLVKEEKENFYMGLALLLGVGLFSYKLGIKVDERRIEKGLNRIFKDNPGFKEQFMDAIANSWKKRG